MLQSLTLNGPLPPHLPLLPSLHTVKFAKFANAGHWFGADDADSLARLVRLPQLTCIDCDPHLWSSIARVPASQWVCQLRSLQLREVWHVAIPELQSLAAIPALRSLRHLSIEFSTHWELFLRSQAHSMQGQIGGEQRANQLQAHQEAEFLTRWTEIFSALISLQTFEVRWQYSDGLVDLARLFPLMHHAPLLREIVVSLRPRYLIPINDHVQMRQQWHKEIAVLGSTLQALPPQVSMRAAVQGPDEPTEFWRQWLRICMDECRALLPGATVEEARPYSWAQV